MKQLRALVARATAPLQGWIGRRSRFQVGLLVIGGTILTLAATLVKDPLMFRLRPGERIVAEFPARHKIDANRSNVKVAGVIVGKVTGVDERPDGAARVEMKVAPGTRAKLGTRPSAAVRPTALFSGRGVAAYVDLRREGDPGRAPAFIPRDRTTLPVELDQVLEILDDDVRHSLRSDIHKLEAALADGGSDALGDLLEAAPGVLRPAGPVLDALAGEHSGDLSRVVADLGRAAEVVTAHKGELEAVVRGLGRVSSRLEARTGDLTRTIEHLPETLAGAKNALAGLDGALTRLEGTAPLARPAVAELRQVLDGAEPVLKKTRPLVGDLRPLIGELRPSLDNLAPTVRSAERLLHDLDGPVLGRLNRDIIPSVLSPYAAGATDPTLDADSPLYQELGDVVAGLAGAVQYTDRNGAIARASVAGKVPDSFATNDGTSRVGWRRDMARRAL